MARKNYEKTDSSAVPPPYHDANSRNDGLYPLREKHQLPTNTPLPEGHPRRLHILAATWGGINVTHHLADMISSQQEVLIDFNTIADVLRPDPAYGYVKTLAVVYQFDGQEGPALLLANEQYPTRAFCISKSLLETNLGESRGSLPPAVTFLPAPFSAVPAHAPPAPAGAYGNAPPRPVQVLAATYGQKRIDTPAVLRELADFFDGRNTRQIRMGNGFFREDPLHGERKEWSVFFRFGDEGRVQCVAGWEDGALEVPWSPWI